MNSGDSWWGASVSRLLGTGACCRSRPSLVIPLAFIVRAMVNYEEKQSPLTEYWLWTILPLRHTAQKSTVKSILLFMMWLTDGCSHHLGLPTWTNCSCGLLGAKLSYYYTNDKALNCPSFKVIPVLWGHTLVINPETGNFLTTASKQNLPFYPLIPMLVYKVPPLYTCLIYAFVVSLFFFCKNFIEL